MSRLPKEQWPHGPWTDEPDTKQWESFGLSCLILRGPGGHLCGYVGVPEGHPTHGLPYYRSDVGLAEILANTIDMAKVRAQHAINNVEVHGGLTYADQGAPADHGNDKWWFGFDCAHAGDVSPAYDAARLGKPTGWNEPYTYRDIGYVTAQCDALAKQISEVGAHEDKQT